MLAELDVLIFLKTQDDLERTAERVFGVLNSSYAVATMDDPPDVTFYEANGMGFHAALYPNTGDLLDPEFDSYGYGLEITSNFWCVELDAIDLEGPLSEYYARQLAFELNIETATEIFQEATEEAEVFEIRAFRRNPQYRLDQGPTTPKVFAVESRLVQRPFEDYDDDTGDYEGEDGDALQDGLVEERP
jgi:hypothetical protein